MPIPPPPLPPPPPYALDRSPRYLSRLPSGFVCHRVHLPPCSFELYRCLFAAPLWRARSGRRFSQRLSSLRCTLLSRDRVCLCACVPAFNMSAAWLVAARLLATLSLVFFFSTATSRKERVAYCTAATPLHMHFMSCFSYYKCLQ